MQEEANFPNELVVCCCSLPVNIKEEHIKILKSTINAVCYWHGGFLIFMVVWLVCCVMPFISH